ncbi:MAG: TetR-like C-terminal domain-containing protein [Minicystis sp.]
MGRRMANLFGACQGQSVFRMLVAEATDPEVVNLKKAMRERHEAIPKAVLAAAVERGELAADVDHTPLFEAFVGALHHKIFAMNERVPDTFVEQVVDLLLYGALQPSAKAKAGR